MFTGFKISVQSTLKKLKVKYLSSEKDSKYIILVGSEKGNTLEFAKFLSAQIQSFGEKVIIKPLIEALKKSVLIRLYIEKSLKSTTKL